jgi:hypothetical protein
VAELVLPDVSKVCNAFETSRNDNPVTQHDTLKANCLSATLLMFHSPSCSCTEPADLSPVLYRLSHLGSVSAVAVDAVPVFICGIMYHVKSHTSRERCHV